MGLMDGFEHIVRENEPLAPFTRLRLGGVAEYYAEPTNKDELLAIIKRAADEDISVRLIGGGSNLLVRDEGVPGLVINLSAPCFCDIRVSENEIIVGGGANLSHFVATAVREGFSGPEQLAGIPGTVGGALHENTGTLNADIGNWAASVSVFTRGGDALERTQDQLNFSYRKSSLTELVILEARFKFESDDSEKLTKSMQKFWIARRANQPMTQENAAYVFKDHGGESAGRLIDQAGLKGMRIGQVQVSDRNPNFFIAESGATSDDVLRLIDLVRSQVKERLSVVMETGLNIW